MELEPGDHYIADLPPDGHVEVELLGPAPPMILREGGGDAAVPRWRVRHEGRELDVVEQAIMERVE